MSERSPARSEHVYHLALRHEWEAAIAEGTPYRRSTVEKSLDEEGFIHCSFRDQVQGVADRFYRGRTDVLLLTIDPAHLEAEIRTEHAFPHIYGPVPAAAVVRVDPIAYDDDGRLLVDDHLDMTLTGPDGAGEGTGGRRG